MTPSLEVSSQQQPGKMKWTFDLIRWRIEWKSTANNFYIPELNCEDCLLCGKLSVSAVIAEVKPRNWLTTRDKPYAWRMTSYQQAVAMQHSVATLVFRNPVRFLSKHDSCLDTSRVRKRRFEWFARHVTFNNMYFAKIRFH